MKRKDSMPVRRVLVFPAGTEIGLEIHASLRDCRNVELFGAGEDISTHARFAFAEYRTVPNVRETGWLERLISLCHELEIDYVFPAHDDALVALSDARDRIPATLVTSCADACTTTRSKSATYLRLAKILPVPRLYASASDVDEFPVLVKPDRGQGSQGVQRIDNREQLELALKATAGAIICSYLPGDEYTVDCFSSIKQGLLFAGARRRRRTRNGISVNTETEDLPEVAGIARKISDELNLRGAWFFQLKRDGSGALTLLEVAPRIAGAMAVHRVSGINFPLLSIFEQEGVNIKLALNPGKIELDRSLRNRYRHTVRFNTLYLDLDDMLVTRSTVNLELIKLLFSCINQHKKIVLISRHADDIDATLRKHRLNGLFDEVIHITDDTPKSRFITDADSIFVDDSFSERQEVARVHGIPTFDSSMIEMLNEQAESLNRQSHDQEIR